MRYTIIILFFIASSFFHIAKAEFIKNNNPILTSDGTNNESGGISTPFVIKDEDIYYMWYSAISDQGLNIHIAVSQDGINWSKNENNPIIRPNNSNTICERNVHDPYVIHDKSLDIYKMWFVANCEPQSTGTPRYWIKYAESSNGVNWIVRDEPVLSPSSSWEIEGVNSPCVIFNGQKYKMWYIGRSSSGKWNIGYAESTNGIDWSKNPNNPIITASKSWELNNLFYPRVVIGNNGYRMYYASSTLWPPTNIEFADSTDGLNWTKPDNNPILTIDGQENSINSPSVIETSSQTRLYYSELVNNIWQISLATEETPIPNIKYILIPGFFGSWNKEAILHNHNEGKWTLAPFITEYNGIINTFDNLGLAENVDYYVFPYDWRASLEDSADKLNEFVNNITNESTKVDIIGHSLGGLIGRIYIQKYGPSHTKKLLTIGSPHKGTAHVYKPLEAGEIDRSNTFLWLAEKFILELNKDGIQSDKSVLSEKLPVLKELLPIYNFLKLGGQDVDFTSMQLKNNTLPNYENSISDIYPVLETISGEKSDTLLGYNIETPNVIDNLLGNYVDGKPTSTSFEIGDYLVLSKSAKLDSDFITESKDHGEIIYSKDAIKTILERLEINFDETKIIEGKKTILSPSLIFAIKSPAELEVYYKGNTYLENDGIIFIPNAQEGTYEIHAIGIEKGKYTIITGKIFENSDEWSEIKGEITNDNPAAQIDTYNIPFTYVTPTQTPTSTPNPAPTNTPNPVLSNTPMPTITKVSKHKIIPHTKVTVIANHIITIIKNLVKNFLVAFGF